MIPRLLPLRRADRWALLDQVLVAWFPSSTDAAGVRTSELDLAEERLGLKLPRSLREWFERFGARKEVWSLQDRLLAPDAFSVEGGVLVFCVENQGVVFWGIELPDLDAEDPPVVVSDASRAGNWIVESESTSAFAIQSALCNAKWSPALSCSADGPATDETLRAIEGRYARLPLADMHWPARPTRLYGEEDLIIESQAETWLWVSARTSRAFSEAEQILRAAGMTWENVSVRG
jgi:hypothetical protein